MNITRRAALGGVACISAVGGALEAHGAPQESPCTDDPSLAALEALIARHAAAMEADRLAWQNIPDDDDPRRPQVNVQIGRHLRGHDANTGARIFEPIYAYDSATIEKAYEKNLLTSLSIYGSTPERADRIRRDHAEWASAKKAELAELEAADQRILDEIGYTAALARTETSSTAVKTVEAEIIAFRPASFAAAHRLATWAIAMIADDWSYVYDDHAISILESIAVAGKQRSPA